MLEVECIINQNKTESGIWLVQASNSKCSDLIEYINVKHGTVFIYTWVAHDLVVFLTSQSVSVQLMLLHMNTSD